MSVLEAAAKTFPRDTPTLYALADIYRDAGRATDAEQALRQVLVIEPANPNALNYLGYLLAMRGDKLDEAVQLVRKALEAEPDNGAYLDSLGWALFKRGDLVEAQKYLGCGGQSHAAATPRCRTTSATSSPVRAASTMRSRPGTGPSKAMPPTWT